MIILYEDNHIIAADKPHNLLTQPDDTGRNSLEDELKAYIKKKSGKSGNVFLHAIHRLDRPAAGIVIFAKTSKALTRLNESMRQGLFYKEYLALVDRPPSKQKDRLEQFLLRDDSGTRVVSANTRGAKEAILDYEVVDDCLLKIILTTGRHHQIRAQLSSIGCPIRGDDRYGSCEEREGIALLHSHTRFPHPIQDTVTLSSSLTF